MKKQITFFSICVALILVLASSAAYAYYADLYKGWEQEIIIGEVSLRLNGKDIDSVTLLEDNIAVGEAYELSLELTSTGNIPSLYTVEMTLPDNYTQTLAPAMEVYAQGAAGEYEFVSMLSEFIKTPVIGDLGSYESKTHNYKLIYSLGAGNFFSETGFTLVVKASSEIITSLESLPYYYVSDAGALKQLTSEAFIGGKTIKLQNNIKLANKSLEDYIFQHKVGLDLNGYTLDLNGYEFRIDYDDARDGKPESWKSLAITDSSPGKTGRITDTAGGGAFNINSPNDAMLIDDYISSQAAAMIKITQFSQDAFAKVVKENIAAFSGNTINRTKNAGNVYVNTALDINKNLKFYMSYPVGAAGSAVSMALGAGEKPEVFSLAGAQFSIPDASRPANTETVYQGFRITYNSANMFEYGYFTVQGTGMFSLAEKLLADIPEVISGSIFLPSYDAFTKASIDWVIGDERLISPEGIFLPQGADVFESYGDREVSIGVIITLEGETVVKNTRTNITVQIMDAAKRTKKIFNESNIFFIDVGDSYTFPIDFGEMYDGSDYTYTFTNIQRTALKNIKVTIKDNIPFGGIGGGSESYISMSYGEDDEGRLQVKIRLDYKSAYDSALRLMEIRYDFEYYREHAQFTFNSSAARLIDNGAVENNGVFDQIYTLDFSGCYSGAYTASSPVISFDMTKRISIVGTSQKQYAVDPTQELKKEFADYYDGKDTYNDFYVKNMLESELEVYYVVAEPFREYVYTERGTDETKIGINKSKVPPQTTTVTIYPYVEQAIYNPDATYYEKLTDTEFRLLTPAEAEAYEGTLYLQYEVYFDVTGILHNIATEIADPALYRALLSACEALPGSIQDGWLTVHEARALSSFSLIAGGVSSIKGMEYFTNLTILQMQNLINSTTPNTIVDVSYLENLTRLTQINFNYNRISDISAFAYMSALTRLEINNNTVTDISPIKYLTNVTYLDLSNNDLLDSFEGIENMTGLRTLYVSNNNSTHTLAENIYYFTLLYINTGNSVIINPITRPTSEQIVAASVLREMLTVYETHTTLNLPASYNLGGTVYRLQWFASENDRDILQIYLEDGIYKYKITSPIIDTYVAITVQVLAPGGDTAYNSSRSFHVNFLRESTDDNNMYIWTGSYYMLAEDAVPDPVLRSLLFRAFNESVSDTTPIEILLQDGTRVNSVANLVLTPAETSRTVNEMLSWDNRGISDLKGLRYFQGITALRIQKNNFVDISELSYLMNIRFLYLDGQYFDFNQLVMDENGVYYDTYTSDRGIKSLYELHVYGSFGLSDETVLTALYHVYRKNNTNTYYVNNASRSFGIYKDVNPASVSNPTTVMWGPYDEPLDKKIRTLPSYHMFYDIDDLWYLTNDGQPTRATSGNNISNAFYQWYFYDDLERGEYPLYFYFTNSFSNILQTSNQASYYITNNASPSLLLPCANNIFRTSLQGLWYARSNLSGTNGNRLVFEDTSTFLYTMLTCANAEANLPGHIRTTSLLRRINMEIIMDFNNDIVIDDYVDLDTQNINAPTQYRQVTLAEAFPGEIIRRYVFQSFWNSTPSGSLNLALIKSRKNRGRDGTIYDDDKYHLSVADFSTLNLDNFIGGTPNTSYASGTSNFGATTSSGGFAYYNQGYSVTRDTYLDTVSYDGQLAIKGLELLPATTRLYIPFDARLGDGRHLIHIKNLLIAHSAIDLTNFREEYIRKAHKYYNSEYIESEPQFNALYKLDKFGVMRNQSLIMATYEVTTDANGYVTGVYDIESGMRFFPNLTQLLFTNYSINVDASYSYINNFAGFITYTDAKFNPYYSGAGAGEFNNEGDYYANQLSIVNIAYQHGSATKQTEGLLFELWKNGYNKDALYSSGATSKLLRSANTTGTMTYQYYLPGVQVSGNPASSANPAQSNWFYKYRGDTSYETDEFAIMIEDFELQISNGTPNGSDFSAMTWTYHYNSDGTLENAKYIKLPRYVQTFVGYNDKAPDGIASQRKLPYTWTVNPQNWILVGTVGTNYQICDVYRAIDVSYDFYDIIEGRLRIYSYTTTTRAIDYPILVKGSASALTYTLGSSIYYSYRIFDDLTLRYLVFKRVSYNSSYRGLFSKTLAADAYTLLDLPVATTNSLLRVDYRYLHQGFKVSTVNTYILSIKGIEYFTALTRINFEGHLISDLTPLYWMANGGNNRLNHLYLSGNLIKDISALRSFYALSDIKLGNNDIQTILYNGQCVFQGTKTSIFSLNLSYNPNLDYADLASLTGCTNLTYLYFFGNEAYGKIETMQALQSVLSYPGLTPTTLYLQLSTYTSQNIALTKSTLLNQLSFILNEAGSILEPYTNVGLDRATWQSNYASGTIIGAAPAYGITRAPTVVFADPYVLKSGVIAAGYTGTLRTKLRVTYDSSNSYPQLIVQYGVKILYSGENSPQFNVTVNINGVATVVNAYDYFDEGIIAYFAREHSGKNLSTVTSIVINDYTGLESLKGFHLLTSLSSLTLAGNAYESRNPIKDLGTSLPPNISMLTLASRNSVSAEIMQPLKTLSRLSSLNLEAMYGIDYAKIINGSALASHIVNFSYLSDLRLNNDSTFVRHYADGQVDLTQTLVEQDYPKYDVLCFAGYRGTKSLSTYTYLGVLRNDHLNGTYIHRYFVNFNLKTKLDTDYGYAFRGYYNIDKYSFSSASSMYRYISTFHTSLRSGFANFNSIVRSVMNLKTVGAIAELTSTSYKLPFYGLTDTHYLSNTGEYTIKAAGTTYIMDYDSPVYMPTYFFYYGKKIKIDLNSKVYLGDTGSTQDASHQQGVFDFRTKNVQRATFAIHAYEEGNSGVVNFRETTDREIRVNYGYLEDVLFDTTDVKMEYEWGEAFDPTGLVITGKFTNVSSILSTKTGFYTELGQSKFNTDMSGFTGIKYGYSLDILGNQNVVRVYIKNNDENLNPFTGNTLGRMYYINYDIEDITVKVNEDALNNKTIVEKDNIQPYFVQTTVGGPLELASDYFESESLMYYLFNNTSINRTSSSGTAGYYYEDGGKYYKTTSASVTSGKNGFYVRNGNTFTKVYKAYEHDSRYVININGTLLDVSTSYNYFYSQYSAVSTGNEQNVTRVRYISEKMVLSKSEITLVSNLSIYSYISSTSTYYSQGMSIEGIEIFNNLRTLTLYGVPASLEPIRDLKLTSFTFRVYSNTYGSSHEIQDWSPLLGSKDTLTTLNYGYSSASTTEKINIQDVSFLTHFTKLSTVTLYTADGLQYTNALKYVLTWLVQNTSISSLSVGSIYVIVGGVINTSVTYMYNDYYKASNIMQYFDTDHPSLAYDGKYLLNLTESAVFSDGGDTAVAKLPDAINFSGEYYPITYTSLSSSVNIDAGNTMTAKNINKKFTERTYILVTVFIDGEQFDRILTLDLTKILPSTRRFFAPGETDGAGGDFPAAIIKKEEAYAEN